MSSLVWCEAERPTDDFSTGCQVLGQKHASDLEVTDKGKPPSGRCGKLGKCFRGCNSQCKSRGRQGWGRKDRGEEGRVLLPELGHTGVEPREEPGTSGAFVTAGT